MAVITVSRQFGSGAEEIAGRVCELLDYRYLDKALTSQVAAEVGLTENEAIDFSEEHYKLQGILERIFRPGPYIVAQLPVWKYDETGLETFSLKKLDGPSFKNLIRSVILAAYGRGNVVILGRGGQILLQNRPDVLHVRIEAPISERMRRIRERTGLSVEASEQLANERDKQSARYLNQLFGVRWDDPLLYHLVLNTGKWSLEDGAQLIVSAVRRLQAELVF